MRWLLTIWFALLLAACSKDTSGGPTGESQLPPEPEEPGSEVPAISDEELLTLTQETTFAYFWDYAEANSGAARERYHPEDLSNDPNTVTTGGSGFGLMAILVGIERGFVSREAAVGRLEQILDFFESADRFHGAWPHWLDGMDGTVRPFSTMDNGADLVETAFLAQGLICVSEYFKSGSDREKALAAQADALWKSVEWNWFTNGEQVLYWHWSPQYDFAINLPLTGYNETLIAYVLAAASPDFSIDREVYSQGWARDGAIAPGPTAYNYPLVFRHSGNPSRGGPLFWAHYSYLGLDPRGLRDAYGDYGTAAENHVRVNYQYCLENPKNFVDYGPDCWGLTASYTRNEDGGIGYSAHSPSNDTGVISPTAAISSIPYTPEESLRALHYFYSHKDRLLGPAGFYDAFSPHYGFWVADAYLAIDQGPIIVMIENYRTGLLWDLFMRNQDVRNGLDKLGFNYGN